jgi:uncharacterized protein (UPF0332 family)
MTEEEFLLDKAREGVMAAKILIRENFPDIAASRGYYAMFYIAEAFLLSRNLAFSSHSAVIAAFGKEFARSKVLDPKFHHYLRTSQEVRLIGDYGIEKKVSPEEASRIIDWAEEFIKAAETYFHDKE